MRVLGLAVRLGPLRLRISRAAAPLVAAGDPARPVPWYWPLLTATPLPHVDHGGEDAVVGDDEGQLETDQSLYRLESVDVILGH